ncbi:hypothetical protein ACFQZC_16745 [Streptacidiphilus monticola]
MRARSDDGLAALLRARPDLVHPVPADLTQLATRLSTRASVVRALERLDRFTLEVAEALAVAPDPVPAEDLLALLIGRDTKAADEPDTADRLPAALAELRGQALLWGPPEALRLVRTVREALGSGPTGLGPVYAEAGAGLPPSRLQEILADAGQPTTPDAVSALDSLHALWTETPDRADALLADAPEGVRGVLHRLMWGPRTARRHRGRSGPPTPAHRWSGCRPAACCCPPGGTRWCCPARSPCTCAAGARTVRCTRCRPRCTPPGRTSRTWWTPPRPGRRSTPSARSRSCWSCSAPSPPPRSGRAASASAICAGRRPRWTCPSRRSRSGSNSPTAPGCWPPTARRTNAGPPPRCSTPGCTARRRNAGPCSPGPGWTPPGWRRWWVPGTARTRCSAPSAPAWTARSRRRSAGPSSATWPRCRPDPPRTPPN